MQKKRPKRKSAQSLHKEKRKVRKTLFQTVFAFVLLVVIWLFSISEQPEVKAFCDKVKHYLTYTVDVKSVFRPFTEINNSGVNENVH